MRQTAFPGMVTAGGGTSGAVMARTARPETDATYAGGTPGIAGGGGGTTGGAATAGTVVEAGQGPSSGTTPATGPAPGTAPAAATPGTAHPAWRDARRRRQPARRHRAHQRRHSGGGQSPAAFRPAQALTDGEHMTLLKTTIAWLLLALPALALRQLPPPTPAQAAGGGRKEGGRRRPPPRRKSRRCWRRWTRITARWRGRAAAKGWTGQSAGGDGCAQCQRAGHSPTTQTSAVRPAGRA